MFDPDTCAQWQAYVEKNLTAPQSGRIAVYEDEPQSRGAEESARRLKPVYHPRVLFPNTAIRSKPRGVRLHKSRITGPNAQHGCLAVRVWDPGESDRPGEDQGRA
jgi:hypothetical protein